jgi:hypothetical protein
MRMIIRLFLAAVLIVTGFALGWWIHGWRPAEDPKLICSTDSGPTLEQIETLSKLTTLKASVADALVTQLRGKTGGITAVLVIHGDVTLGVDLSKASFGSVDARSRTATLVLPTPRIQSVSLDQEKTKVVALCENGLWIIAPRGEDADAAVANLAYREAQRILARAAKDPDLIERARRQTEEIVTVFFAAIYWVIQVRWIGESRSPQ